MKLIKKGIDPKDIIKYCTCDNCKSEYEYTENDPEIKKYVPDQRDRFDSSYSYLTCQVCNTRIRISTRITL